jgi:hypothetical protein
MTVTRRSIRDYLATQRARYARASRAERHTLLDETVAGRAITTKPCSAISAISARAGPRRPAPAGWASTRLRARRGKGGREGITFTRSRAYRKNDSAHVKQKNGALVRALIGYDRYTSRAAYTQLARVHRLLRLQAYAPIILAN